MKNIRFPISHFTLICLCSFVLSKPSLLTKGDSVGFGIGGSDFIQTSLSASSGNHMAEYFYNLKSNITNNTNNCCAYVAMEMLLSYYEINWDTNLLPDALINESSGSTLSQLLQSSPGAKPFGDLQYCNNDYAWFYNAYVAGNDNYLFARLLQVAYDDSFYNAYVYVSELQQYMYAGLQLDDGQVSQVLSDYITSYTNLSSSVSVVAYERASTTEAQRISFIKNEIDQGRPVIVGLYENQNTILNGHSCIAYDYELDANNNVVFYYHCGWQNDSRTHARTNGTKYISEAISLQTSQPHSHSFHYELSGQDFCVCNIYSSHPSHSHSYTFSYQGISNLHHFAYCMCGDRIRQMHGFVMNQNGNMVCERCGHVA